MPLKLISFFILYCLYLIAFGVFILLTVSIGFAIAAIIIIPMYVILILGFARLLWIRRRKNALL
jgi:hypothetical protein